MLIINLFYFIIFSKLYNSHHHNETSTNSHHHHNHKKDHKDHSNNNNSFKKIKLTYYWISNETLFPEGTQKEVKSCSPDGEGEGGKLIKKVSKEFYESLHMEGSGKLKSGKFINCGNDDCTCFNQVPGPQGSKGNQLNVYTSGASKSVKLGTKIFIKEFKGLKLPSGEIHNGCIKIDDTGYGLERDQIDLFSFFKTNYERINKDLRLEEVRVNIGSNCKVKAYSSKIC